MPKIRPYTAADWDRFLELDLETGLAGMERATEQERAAFSARWPSVLRATYAWSDDGPTAGTHTISVVETDDGGYAGHLWLSETKDFFTGLPRLHITTLAVVARYRGRGLGRALLETAVDEARARGLATITLGVDAQNAGALRLYEEFGFRTTRLAMERSVD